MKKKIIISLILAMCCIVVSIPVAASIDDGASTYDIICKPHGEFTYACGGGTPEEEADSHEFTTSVGTATCTYTAYKSRTYISCGICNKIINSSHYHSHGGYGHVNPSRCGMENGNVCVLGRDW